MPRQANYFMTVMVFIFCLALLSVGLPIVAQEGGFATNTPAPTGNASSGFGIATSTPSGGFGLPTSTPQPTATSTPLPTATPGPATSLFNYALHTWLESELVDLAFGQIEQIQNGVRESRLALQVTLYELERRFPGAPRNPEQRWQMIDAMLEAPVGSIDMRSIVRPAIQIALNEQPDATSLEVNGFQVFTQPANLNNLGGMDALVQILYTNADDDSVIYNDYVLALRNDVNALTFLDTTYDLFATPFGGIRQVKLEEINDVNGDAVDEIVLRVDDGNVNSRLYIIAARNGVAVELTEPGEEIRFGEVISWPTDTSRNPVLTVLQLRRESSAPNWPCRSAQPVNWTYDRNFYRPSTELNTRFETIDSLGCTLYEAEPLFAMPPADAIGIIETALIDYGFEADGADRALLTLAMFYVLQGRLADAQTTAQSVIPAGDETSWAARQGNALLAATGIASNTALDICEALALASEDPACDMNSVLGTYLEVLELTTDEDLAEQLNGFGLPVLESITRSEIGKADRTVLNFDLFDTAWWGFVAQRDGTYAVEPAEAPEGFEEAILPAGPIRVPQAAYDALFVDNDPANVLAILENVENDNPDSTFRAVGFYLRALSYDLTNDRESARVGYYDVWERFPETIWGQLAAEHLEQR